MIDNQVENDRDTDIEELLEVIKGIRFSNWRSYPVQQELIRHIVLEEEKSESGGVTDIE